MSRWFRFHSEAIRRPKVARLSDGQYRLWTELMCVAAENDGAIPCLDDLKHILKRRLDHLSRGLDDLRRARLIDPLGDGYEPHNWSKHQYKSDTSTARVQKHRAERNVSETPPDTDTDTDTEEEEAKASPSQRARPVKPDPFTRPDWADSQHWLDFLANRKARSCQNTTTAYKKFLADIARLTSDDWPPGRLLEHAAANGWAGIYEPRESQNGSQIQTARGSRDCRDGVAKALDRRLGLDDVAGAFGRRDAREGAGNCALPASRIAGLR